MKILVLGGYGAFGGRLIASLSDLPGLHFIVGGRSLEKAEAFCASLSCPATLKPMHVDRQNADTAIRLAQPDLVIDASGPFQSYGDDPYQVVKSCISASVPYMDFADGTEFVGDTSRFDEVARKAGIFVLSGVSSFPVLTAAVVRTLSKNLTPKEVEAGVAPSPRAGLGLSVLKAVIGYAGGPVKVFRNGVYGNAPGLAESRRHTIAPPGRVPLRSTRFSLVDVPDLRIIPEEHPVLRSVWVGAGPRPEVLHLILNAFAKLRWRLHLPTLEPLAPAVHRVLNLAKFGEHRSGMYVEVRGVGASQEPVIRSWHLVAEDDDGPRIPAMAIEALVRKIVAGDPPLPGARVANRELELDDYESLFRTCNIATGIREDTGESQMPLYGTILGSALKLLPSTVQTLHSPSPRETWRGSADVQRGKGVLAAFIAKIVGFPGTGKNVPVTVQFTTTPDRETWTRDFDGRSFFSIQSAGTGRSEGLLVERFGPIAIAMAPVVDRDKLRLIPRRLSFLGIPLPSFLLPTGDCHETERDGRFHFHVEITFPIVGNIVTYIGNLDRVPRKD